MGKKGFIGIYRHRPGGGPNVRRKGRKSNGAGAGGKSAKKRRQRDRPAKVSIRIDSSTERGLRKEKLQEEE